MGLIMTTGWCRRAGLLCRSVTHRGQGKSGIDDKVFLEAIFNYSRGGKIFGLGGTVSVSVVSSAIDKGLATENVDTDLEKRRGVR